MLLTENGPGLVIKLNKIESQPFENEINGHKKKQKTNNRIIILYFKPIEIISKIDKIA
jgi:hypothetical protein